MESAAATVAQALSGSAAKRVTRTSTVFVDSSGTVEPTAPDVGTGSAPTQVVTVIYVTRTRTTEETADSGTSLPASPTPCTNYVCPNDCDDWSCYEDNLAQAGSATTGPDGTRTRIAAETITPAQCTGYVRCVDYKCSHNETFSYDLALLWRDVCGQPLDAARVRQYPRPLPPVVIKATTSSRMPTTSSIPASTTTVAPVQTTTKRTTTSLTTSAPGETTSRPATTGLPPPPAAAAQEGLGAAVIVPIVVALIVTCVAAVIGGILACRKWKARVYKTAAAMANSKELPPMSPNENGYPVAPAAAFAVPEYREYAFPDHVSVSSARSPTTAQTGTTVPLPHGRDITSEDVRMAMEAAKATPRAVRAPSSVASSKRSSVAGSLRESLHHPQAMHYAAGFPASPSAAWGLDGESRRPRGRSRAPSLAGSSESGFTADYPASPASTRVRSPAVYSPVPAEHAYISPKADRSSRADLYYATPRDRRSRADGMASPRGDRGGSGYSSPRLPEGFLPQEAMDARAAQLAAEALQGYYSPAPRLPTSRRAHASGYASPRPDERSSDSDLERERPRDRERRKRRSRADLLSDTDLIGSYSMPLGGRGTDGSTGGYY
ncbi:hypothetical protein DFJ74DRAFT_677240 [Hyaloraphidium curvatum]|nr:hypothetical protein DFJ74DRAFT_677240 [Hyaloraphidium curvatum]